MISRAIIVICLVSLFTNCTNKEIKQSTNSSANAIIKDTLVKNNNKTDLHKVSEECLEMVFKIIESSTHYKELTNGLQENIVKNGGTGFGFTVHVSPNPTLDHAFEKGDFYEISIHESYPDHMTNIAHYRFDRHQKLLFVLDVVSAEYEEITFDSLLIKDFDLACKE